MVNYTFQQALVFMLRASGIRGIEWGATDSLDSAGSPYYQELPEPPAAFPFVVLLIPDSRVDQTFESYYNEYFTPEVHLVGIEADVIRLGAPTSDESVIAYLDSMEDSPQSLQGNRFTCNGWLRKDWRLDRDANKTRAPDGQRVWIASAKYEAMVTVQRLLWRGLKNG